VVLIDVDESRDSGVLDSPKVEKKLLYYATDDGEG
jgi:hypothetical protein